MEKKVTYVRKNTPEAVEDIRVGDFKLTRTKIKSMYDNDDNVKHNVNKTTPQASSINTMSIDSLKTNYYNLNNIVNPRKYANELYTFNPIFSTMIDYLSNMFLWRYTYVPRLVKEKKAQGDYNELYRLMGEVVDGLSIETTFPMMLTQLLLDGALYLIGVKNTSSATITTLSLPTKYCRVNSITQFGTYTYQFDYSYFDDQGYSKEELETIFDLYPKEMRIGYNAYLTDKTNLRWQQLDPKFAGAILLNKNAFPTRLHAIFSLKQYEQYQDNELERNDQLLDKIIAHKMPTWEDRLVVDIDEMTELHKSMSKVLSKNAHIRLLTTFGDMQVLSIGKDESKENKTLNNAYNTIFDNNGLNNGLFNGAVQGSLDTSLDRDASIMWKYIEQLISYYNLVINNSFNFKGYQCDLTMLPITIYNEQEKMLVYKEGATLGVTKLEYIVSTGVKQINLQSKIELEDMLGLDKLKPLSTSYTQNDNSKQGSDADDQTDKPEDEKVSDNPEEQDDAPNKEDDDNIKEQEVNNSEEDTE